MFVLSKSSNEKPYSTVVYCKSHITKETLIPKGKMPNMFCSCKSCFTIKELYLLISVPNTLIHSEISKYDSEIHDS